MSDLRLTLVGDLVLDEPDSDSFFDHVRAPLADTDVLIGHVEVPHTTRGVESVGDIPAPASAPENLRALGRAGFHVATLAGNHIHDRGGEGIEDTRANLLAQGISVTGAGANLMEARAPAIVERGGRRVGVLSYNCVGPKEGYATAKRPGCAHIRIISHYELENANPGGPPKAYTFPEPDHLEAMQADVAALRAQVDVVIVVFHKGLVHTPQRLAMYERPVARAAVEAGADVVAGSHGHVLQGVEVYKGKPIFHGLGNFVVVTRALGVDTADSPERKAWAIKRKVLFGFEPDPDYPLYPFHPEAKNLIVADCRIADDGTVSAGFRPGWMRPTGQPEILGQDARGEAVADYVRRSGEASGLRTAFRWDGARVVFEPA